MKIAVVITGGLHPSGRVEIIPALLWYLERLARAHEVHAFAVRHLPAPSDYRLAGIHVHDLGRPRGRWRQWHTLRRALHTHGPFDVIHGYWADPPGLLAALAGRVLGIPSVVTCTGGEFTALPAIGYGLQRHWRGRIVTAAACRLATAVHVDSGSMAALAAAHGIAAEQIPVGVEPSLLEACSPPRDGPPWQLLQVATLNPVKDQSTLLDALARVRRSHDARLHLVGEDTRAGAVQRQAAALGLADAVSFYGFVPHDKLAPIRRAAHVYVQSSLHEASGIAVLEAAAAGLPIVGTRVGYVSDWEGTGAIAVSPGDAAQLATAIVAVLDDAATRRRIADTARRWAAAHDAEYTVRAMTALFQRLRDAPNG